MNDTKTAFMYVDSRGIPHFNFSEIIPMPKVIPPRQENVPAYQAKSLEAEPSKSDENK
jgi:hypothetical protein